MSQTNLNVATRSETGKGAAKRLRNEGRVPAVLYGHHETPQILSVDAREVRDLLAHKGSHGLLMLTQDGKSEPAIIKSLQRHAVNHSVAAIDFLRVSLNEEVTASVPVVLEGELADVKSGDGVLVQSLLEIVVSALPQNLPENVVVDVSGLETNGAPLHVSDIALPAGVKAVTEGTEAVAVVNLPEPEEEPITDATEVEEPIGEEEVADASDSVPSTQSE